MAKSHAQSLSASIHYVQMQHRLYKQPIYFIPINCDHKIYMKTLTHNKLEEIILCRKLAKYHRTLCYVFCVLCKEHESYVMKNGKFLEKEILTNRVLAEPWDPRRMNSVMSAMIGGIPLPPIQVAENIWRGEPYYTLTDGNHRTANARIFRCKTISAQISGTSICDTSKVRFYNEILHHQEPDAPEVFYYIIGREKVEFAACCFLKAMGIESQLTILGWINDFFYCCRYVKDIFGGIFVGRLKRTNLWGVHITSSINQISWWQWAPTCSISQF